MAPPETYCYLTTSFDDTDKIHQWLNKHFGHYSDCEKPGDFYWNATHNPAKLGHAKMSTISFMNKTGYEFSMTFYTKSCKEYFLAEFKN